MEGKEEFSTEANEQMLSFLRDMEELQRKNPDAFNEILNSMGVTNDDPSKESNGSASSMKRQSVIDAISQLREGDNGVISGLELPGGKGTLSAEGVKNKMKGITITPEPGYTIKTRREDDSKVFINLCQHSELAVPSIKKKLNEEGEEVEGMNIPLSVGQAKEGKDKSGVPCTIYDVIVNPQVLKDVLSDVTGKHRDFICQLAIQSIEQKYKLNLDKRYKLPKIRYLGEITSQQIQDRKQMPKIEEIEVKGGAGRSSSSSAHSKAKQMNGKEIKPAAKEPDRALAFTLHWKYEDNSEVLVEDNSSLVQEYETKLTTLNSMQLPNPSARLYTEPLTLPDDEVKSLIFRTLLDVKLVSDPSNISLNLSAFRFDLKVAGYLPCHFYFPCAVATAPASSAAASTGTSSPSSASAIKSVLHRLPGYTQVFELVVIIPIDSNPWNASADPGSKPWLVAEALRGEDGSASSPSPTQQQQKSSEVGGEKEEYAEDKFHLNLPDNVDKYTGVKYPAEQNDEFPEDRFHRQDAISQYILDQREKDIKAKWDKHEKEKAERKDDPNVEYIDVEDFKPGGKYGPQPVVSSSIDNAPQEREDLQRAADIVASSSIRDGAKMESQQSHGISLSSHLWTELLD